MALNRPKSHNAFNTRMVEQLSATFQELGRDPSVRVIVLTGRGRSFCAGADLTMMRAAAGFSHEENVADGRSLFDLMFVVDQCRKAVIGRINGSAIGGGCGLVSCCDVAIAVDRAKFGFSETRLGLVPAVISPFVLARIGAANARELFLTGERFDAPHARRIGLVQHVVPETELDDKVAERVKELLLAAPGAQAAAKHLIREVAHSHSEQVREFTAQLIAERRASQEGREGMSAFLEKRKPSWQ